jgi:hypothetical protein
MSVGGGAEQEEIDKQHCRHQDRDQ